MVPDAVVKVNFQVAGAGDLIGEGNRNPHNVDSFKRPPHGQAFAIPATSELALRSDTHSHRGRAAAGQADARCQARGRLAWFCQPTVTEESKTNASMLKATAKAVALQFGYLQKVMSEIFALRGLKGSVQGFHHGNPTTLFRISP